MKKKNFISLSSIIGILFASFLFSLYKSGTSEVNQPATNTTSFQKEELRSGYIHGCTNSGLSEVLCNCVFDKTIEKYGVTGMGDLMKIIANSDNESEEFKEYSLFAGKSVLECDESN